MSIFAVGDLSGNGKPWALQYVSFTLQSAAKQHSTAFLSFFRCVGGEAYICISGICTCLIVLIDLVVFAVTQVVVIEIRVFLLPVFISVLMDFPDCLTRTLICKGSYRNTELISTKWILKMFFFNRLDNRRIPVLHRCSFFFAYFSGISCTDVSSLFFCLH